MVVENENRNLLKELQIRYVKLHFTIEFDEDTIMPRNKVSAIRGGVGEMLLRMNCICDRNCMNCDFTKECIVQRIMYSTFDIQPESVNTQAGIGYVYECNNTKEQFLQGEKMEFQLLLFGKTIVYFNQYLQAIYGLGQQGIGKNYSRFHIVEIRNSKKEVILHKNSLYMEQYQVETVADYVNDRFKKLKEQGQQNKIIFSTPLTLKYQNEFIQQFSMKQIFTAINRRIYMLNCFEGLKNELHKQQIEDRKIVFQKSKMQEVGRYSFRKEEKMILRGITGVVETEPLSDDEVKLLLAGELLHIGKNTSFGFGKYKIL